MLEHDGNPVPLSTVSDVAGGEGPSPWLEIRGTFSIKVSAGDGVRHTVTVCGETAPSGSNKSDLDSR